jgi:hypothetical protein
MRGQGVDEASAVQGLEGPPNYPSGPPPPPERNSDPPTPPFPPRRSHLCLVEGIQQGNDAGIGRRVAESGGRALDQGREQSLVEAGNAAVRVQRLERHAHGRALRGGGWGGGKEGGVCGRGFPMLPFPSRVQIAS